jgi:DnaJ-class molecular chaperone
VRGDLLVQIMVTVPATLSEEQRRLYEALRKLDA